MILYLASYVASSNLADNALRGFVISSVITPSQGRQECFCPFCLVQASNHTCPEGNTPIFVFRDAAEDLFIRENPITQGVIEYGQIRRRDHKEYCEF